MIARNNTYTPVTLSLADLLGEAYMEAVCDAGAALSGSDPSTLLPLATQPVELFPEDFQRALRKRLPHVGSNAIGTRSLSTAAGAGSAAFNAAASLKAAPLSASGYFRVGEDGRLYLTAKSEHYQASLGHAFPGFELVRLAERLGIPNPTHNNTRGHATRLLELELVRIANGLKPGDGAGLGSILASKDARVLNRVLNLSTGSLAAEAALKMVLARFYRAEAGGPPPAHGGATPVILVLGDDHGNLQGNYHGTTILTQMMRGMWPGLADTMHENGLLTIRALRPNRKEDVDKAFVECMRPPYRIAGFFHEIVMMNYGARLLDRDYLEHAYRLCHEHNVPIVDDEIQTGLWSPELLMYREYGLKPTAVAVGKGFPGGQCAASRVLFSATLDSMAQFGALVTNGQEDLSSLAYLVAIRWAEANGRKITEVGDYFESRLNDLAQKHRDAILGIEGSRHLSGIAFSTLEGSKSFVAELNAMGIDISVQAYKENCPPVVLTKLPLIVDEAFVDFLIDRMFTAMKRVHIRKLAGAGQN